jgi:hypothetical protein
MPCGTKKRTKPPSSRVKAVRVPIRTKSRLFVAYNNYDYYPNLGRELHPYEVPIYISSISGYQIPDKYQQAQYHLIHAHYPKFSEKKPPKIFSFTGIPHNKLERVLVKHDNIQKNLNKSDPNYERASANAVYEISKFARHKRVTKGRKSHRS